MFVVTYFVVTDADPLAGTPIDTRRFRIHDRAITHALRTVADLVYPGSGRRAEVTPERVDIYPKDATVPFRVLTIEQNPERK